MKFIQKTLSNASNSSNTGANKSKEYVRVKLEVTGDNKHQKELDGLKNSYQRYSYLSFFKTIHLGFITQEKH